MAGIVEEIQLSPAKNGMLALAILEAGFGLDVGYTSEKILLKGDKTIDWSQYCADTFSIVLMLPGSGRRPKPFAMYVATLHTNDLGYGATPTHWIMVYQVGQRDSTLELARKLAERFDVNVGICEKPSAPPDSPVPDPTLLRSADPPGILLKSADP